MKKEKVLKYLPLMAMALIIVLFGATLKKISIQNILSITPDNYLLAALTILGLYALKSVSVVFPLLVLYIAVGAIFPMLPAVLLNTVGLLICISIPYFIGRFSGSEAVSKLVEKYPKARQMSEYSSKNAVFLSYLLRVINLLPGDVVSMVLGASGMEFTSYTVGSMLGLLPVMIPAVLVGRSIENPLSLQFVVSFAAMIIISLGSTIWYNRRQKRKKRNEQ
ncbi:VTT domain-containing protein [Hydrogenoanaerobacterium sp.]|uniref:TVP38/TMEM64 family protein n=1 Tax=Hydrogenoanaerobacterium sp. TaxID=2953763 RepID=UPI0028A2D128|nr:VTT domain-containing protein [Hydrogenoanaerobacterium sp.]